MRVPVLSTAEPTEPEQGAWAPVRAGWRLLYGSFAAGVSLEWHRFKAPDSLDWGRSFHPESVELCLNQAGHGEVRVGREVVNFSPSTSGIYGVGARAIEASRAAGEEHRFITLEMRHEFLAEQVAGCPDAVPAGLHRLITRRGPSGFAGPVGALTSTQASLVARLTTPPVSAAALPLWYQGKVCELIAEFVFAPPAEMFCARHQRLARERVERVRDLLRSRLDDPPSLEELGREVGVSQFYLSRTFSQEMGMTIPQFLRRVRMERAAELLRDGRHNVTEAAFAVGYSSLGHFSKSFCEVMGCCPTLYPHARHLARI